MKNIGKCFNTYLNFAFHHDKLVKDYQLQTESFVREIVLIREGTLELPNRVSSSRLELDQLVHVVSLSSFVTS